MEDGTVRVWGRNNTVSSVWSMTTAGTSPRRLRPDGVVKIVCGSAHMLP
jgi:hypothetical protein